MYANDTNDRWGRNNSTRKSRTTPHPLTKAISILGTIPLTHPHLIGRWEGMMGRVIQKRKRIKTKKKEKQQKTRKYRISFWYCCTMLKHLTEKKCQAKKLFTVNHFLHFLFVLFIHNQREAKTSGEKSSSGINSCCFLFVLFIQKPKGGKELARFTALRVSAMGQQQGTGMVPVRYWQQRVPERYLQSSHKVGQATGKVCAVYL